MDPHLLEHPVHHQQPVATFVAIPADYLYAPTGRKSAIPVATPSTTPSAIRRVVPSTSSTATRTVSAVAAHQASSKISSHQTSVVTQTEEHYAQLQRPVATFVAAPVEASQAVPIIKPVATPFATPSTTPSATPFVAYGGPSTASHGESTDSTHRRYLTGRTATPLPQGGSVWKLLPTADKRLTTCKRPLRRQCLHSCRRKVSAPLLRHATTLVIGNYLTLPESRRLAITRRVELTALASAPTHRQRRTRTQPAELAARHDSPTPLTLQSALTGKSLNQN